jgi:hypothetical protein
VVRPLTENKRGDSLNTKPIEGIIHAAIRSKDIILISGIWSTLSREGLLDGTGELARSVIGKISEVYPRKSSLQLSITIESIEDILFVGDSDLFDPENLVKKASDVNEDLGPKGYVLVHILNPKTYTELFIASCITRHGWRVPSSGPGPTFATQERYLDDVAGIVPLMGESLWVHSSVMLALSKHKGFALAESCDTESIKANYLDSVNREFTKYDKALPPKTIQDCRGMDQVLDLIGDSMMNHHKTLALFGVMPKMVAIKKFDPAFPSSGYSSNTSRVGISMNESLANVRGLLSQVTGCFVEDMGLILPLSIEKITF